jgi:CheY-like chemotaxis protein
VTGKKTIVAVDDEPGMCETFQDLFEDEGYDVRIARDGHAALDLLRSLPVKPCIVITDILMPFMDGPALYRAAKADPALATIPFVFTTTDPARAPAGELIMKKPLNFEVLLDIVRKCCGAGVLSVAS